MKKRIVAGLLAAILLLLAIAPAVSAAEATSGSCGEGISWSYSDHTLTISGSGEMADGSPWEAYKDKIENVIFTGGVTKVGAKAFENYDSLETIDFGDSMREIGKRAFYDCNDIEEIRMPETFRIFGEECFRNCQLLKRVICEGGIMPSFKSACLHTGNYISIFYPPNAPWSWEYYQPVMTAYGGLLGFHMASEEIMENGYVEETTAPEETEAEETEETVAETEAVAAVAEETVPETREETVPETEPATEATEPVTEETEAPTTEPTTVSTTEPETQEPETTEAALDLTQPTEPESIVEKKSSSGWMGLAMIAGALTFLIAGALIFRSTTKGGRY